MSEGANKDDPFALERFVTVQVDTYQRACDELRCGRKRRHWMWFGLPPRKWRAFLIV